LIITVNDIIENRIENNLRNISRVVMVDLPENADAITLEEFVDLQNI
jgi:dynein heavy chain